MNSLPKDKPLDNSHASWAMAAEVCMRLMNKNFDFNEDDNFSSVGDCIKHVCERLSLPESRSSYLCKAFNTQVNWFFLFLIKEQFIFTYVSMYVCILDLAPSNIFKQG